MKEAVKNCILKVRSTVMKAYERNTLAKGSSVVPLGTVVVRHLLYNFRTTLYS